MKKVLVIVGPTAVGKTSLSIELAKKFNGEVINGDSVQIYKALNIGSAKVTEDEMKGVKHHLLSFKNPDEPFSVAEFQMLVRNKIDEITKRGKLPIICGGTGLYIQAVIYDFRFEKEERSEDFMKKYENTSNEVLHQILFQIDDKEAKKIHINNRRRVLRALEIYEKNKKTKSELINKQKDKPLYDAYIVGLDMDRKRLYERINKRVDLMIENNLLEEVKSLYDKGYRVNAIGYKEFNDYFDNKITLDEVIKNIKKNTRHYAKRQLTYFRNKLDIHWYRVDVMERDELTQDIVKNVKTWINI